MLHLDLFGISYSQLMNGLKNKNIVLNRKMLSELAVSDQSTFEKIIKTTVD